MAKYVELEDGVEESLRACLGMLGLVSKGLNDKGIGPSGEMLPLLIGTIDEIIGNTMHAWKAASNRSQDEITTLMADAATHEIDKSRQHMAIHSLGKAVMDAMNIPPEEQDALMREAKDAALGKCDCPDCRENGRTKANHEGSQSVQ